MVHIYLENFNQEISMTESVESAGDILLSNRNINENEAIGTSIGTLSIQDEDSASFTFTLSGTDVDSFTIDGTTLKSAVVFDYETKNSYSITIQATDGSTTFNQNFQINILNVNESPTNIYLSNNTIYENRSIGTIVGLLTGEDVDSTSFTFTLSGTDADSFTIDGTTLKSAVIFDYQTKNIYNITITISDGSTTFSKDFQIDILNVNESPTNIYLSNNTIYEKRSIGTIVGLLTGEDVDSTSFTFTLSGTDVDSFTIDGTILKSARVFNYQTKNIYNITITISDGSTNFSKDFIIRILYVKPPFTGGSGPNGPIIYSDIRPRPRPRPRPEPEPDCPSLPPIEDVVNAYIDVNIEKMRETFKFTKKTNMSILSNYTEIKYVIEPQYFLEELAKRVSSAYTKYSDFNNKDINKIFQESEYNSENNTLTNDMMKHISQELFNNFHLTDLFKNYDQLIHYLNDSLQTMVNTGCDNVFNDTFMKGHEMTNSYHERYHENNIGHTIIKYMYDSEPLRLGNIYDFIKESYDRDDNVVDIVSINSDKLSLYCSPFEENDTLHFYLTINAHEDQKHLVNEEGQISRRYKIILVMKPAEYFEKEDDETENLANLEKMGFQEIMEMQKIEKEMQKNMIMKVFSNQMQRKPGLSTNKITRDKIEQLYKIQRARKKQKTKQNQLLLGKYLLKLNGVKTIYNKKRIIKRPQPTNTFEVALPVKEQTDKNNKNNYKTTQQNLVGLTYYKKIQLEITDIRR